MAGSPDGHVCQDCFADTRHQHLLARRRDERGRLTDLDEDVARRIRRRESIVLADDVARRIRRHESVVLTDHGAADAATTLGERVAESMARWGGLRPFGLGFVALLVLWTLTNGLVLRNRGFDPYPFLLLSPCSPAWPPAMRLITMSQNYGRRARPGARRHRLPCPSRG